MMVVMLRFRRAVRLAMGLSVGLAAVPLAGQAPKLDLSEGALVAAASRYVAEYEKNFAFLIADETYTQSLFGANVMTRYTGLTPGNLQARQTRVMRSEIFLTFLPADGEWIAVRDVMEVDGEPVAGREDLRKLLERREEMRGLTSRLVARNARYNIGNVQRNFNEPTLPLLLLEPKRVAGVKFDRKKIERSDGLTLVTLGFNERRDTLVTGPRGPLPAKGEVVIDAATGTVRRTTFELSTSGTNVKLATTYARDDKLNLWLPSVFTERYETDSGAMRELVLCEAKYSNYRRFEVTAKIK